MKIAEIKERLDNCIDIYVDLFCKKQDAYSNGWVGGMKGGIIEIADAYLSLEDNTARFRKRRSKRCYLELVLG